MRSFSDQDREREKAIEIRKATITRPTHDAAQVIGGIVPLESLEPVDLTVPREYLNGFVKALKHLATYSANAPAELTATTDERRKYVVGYALPFLHAGVPVDVVMDAVHRFKESGDEFFPRNPAKLLAIARTILRERAPGFVAPRALEAPYRPVSREERNEQRVRLGLEPLPEEPEGA